MTNETPDFEAEPRLPEPVRAVLNSRFGLAPNVPECVDKSILADAASHLSTAGTREHRPEDLESSQRRIRRFLFASLTIATTCAAVMLVLRLKSPPQMPPTTLSDAATPSAEVESPVLRVVESDFDQSGRVDILDAFALARNLRDGAVVSDEWDVNHDGVFNDADVQHIASSVVML